MAILTNLPTSITGNSVTSVTLSTSDLKTSIAALTNDSYWNDTTIWKAVTFLYKNSDNQSYPISFNLALSNSANLTVPSNIRNESLQCQRIDISGFNNDCYTIYRNQFSSPSAFDISVTNGYTPIVGSPVLIFSDSLYMATSSNIRNFGYYSNSSFLNAVKNNSYDTDWYLNSYFYYSDYLSGIAISDTSYISSISIYVDNIYNSYSFSDANLILSIYEAPLNGNNINQYAHVPVNNSTEIASASISFSNLTKNTFNSFSFNKSLDPSKKYYAFLYSKISETDAYAAAATNQVTGIEISMGSGNGFRAPYRWDHGGGLYSSTPDSWMYEFQAYDNINLYYTNATNVLKRRTGFSLESIISNSTPPLSLVYGIKNRNYITYNYFNGTTDPTNWTLNTTGGVSNGVNNTYAQSSQQQTSGDFSYTFEIQGTFQNNSSFGVMHSISSGNGDGTLYGFTVNGTTIQAYGAGANQGSSSSLIAGINVCSIKRFNNYIFIILNGNVLYSDYAPTFTGLAIPSIKINGTNGSNGVISSYKDK